MPTDNWNTIIQLVSKTVGRVIYNYNILYIPICNNPKIFYIDSVYNYATLPIQSVLNKIFVWIQVVEYSICVALMAGSENRYLEMTASFLQAFTGIRSNIQSGIHNFSRRKCNWKSDVTVLFGVSAVCQCLIKVKDQKLGKICTLWQNSLFIIELLLFYWL